MAPQVIAAGKCARRRRSRGACVAPIHSDRCGQSQSRVARQHRDMTALSDGSDEEDEAIRDEAFPIDANSHSVVADENIPQL